MAQGQMVPITNCVDFCHPPVGFIFGII